MKTLVVITSLSLIVTATAAAGPVAANHGYSASYSSPDALCGVTAKGDWIESEYWEPGLPVVHYFRFDIVRGGAACSIGQATTCVGRGNIEQGFVRDDARSMDACPGDFSVGGTGHFHTCCDPGDVDLHTGIPLTIAGATVETNAVIHSVDAV